MIHYGKKISFCIHIQYKSSSPHRSTGRVAVCRDTISYYHDDPARQELLFRDLVVLLRMLAKSEMKTLECKNCSKFSKIFGNYFNYSYLCSGFLHQE